MRRFERRWWLDGVTRPGCASLACEAWRMAGHSESELHCSRVVLITLGLRVGSLTENFLISNANYASSTITGATKTNPHFCSHRYRRTASSSRIRSCDAHLAPMIITPGSTFCYWETFIDVMGVFDSYLRPRLAADSCSHPFSTGYSPYVSGLQVDRHLQRSENLCNPELLRHTLILHIALGSAHF